MTPSEEALSIIEQINKDNFFLLSNEDVIQRGMSKTDHITVLKKCDIWKAKLPDCYAFIWVQQNIQNTPEYQHFKTKMTQKQTTTS